MQLLSTVLYKETPLKQLVRHIIYIISLPLEATVFISSEKEINICLQILFIKFKHKPKSPTLLLISVSTGSLMTQVASGFIGF